MHMSIDIGIVKEGAIHIHVGGGFGVVGEKDVRRKLFGLEELFGLMTMKF